VSDGSGGIALVWRDDRSGDSDIYFSRFDGAGQVVSGWPVGGTPLVTRPGTQRRPVLVMADALSAVVVWEDLRAIPAQLYAQKLQFDRPVPALASLQSATASTGHAALVWLVNDAVASMRVERSDSQGQWASLGSVSVSGDRRVTWRDEQVVPGQRMGYRLVDLRSGSVVPGSEVWIDIPRELALSLGGFDPNPAGPDAVVAFTLPVAAPAELAIFDVSGRQVFARDVGFMGGGRHRVAIRENGLRPGFYLVRLTQAGESKIQRGVVLR
jgi:hypothetical protein